MHYIDYRLPVFMVLVSGSVFLSMAKAANELNKPIKMEALLTQGSTEEELQSIATGHPLPARLSPSVTSVMTSYEIEKIGARRLYEVLEYLPGIHVSSARGGNRVVGFRGIYSETGSQVLILVNGIPLRNTVTGGKPLAWDMPVKNISHVEIIRGPGSMLYGGDAISGVINIVLKTGKELRGGKAGGFFGTQDTYEGWMQYGQQKDAWEVAFAVQGGTTRGNQGQIYQDLQSYLDQIFHTQASNAPGSLNNARNDLDIRLDIGYRDWGKLRFGYQGFHDVGPGEGGIFALDKTRGIQDDLYQVDFTIQDQFLTSTLRGGMNVFYLGQDVTQDLMLLPPGAWGGLLPQGQHNIAHFIQRCIGLNAHAVTTHFMKHQITFGAGFASTWIPSVTNLVNYDGFTQIALTDVANTSGRNLTLFNKHRTNFYTLLQDEWKFFPDFTLTTGVRYDYYTDIAGALNPRIALVWNVGLDLTTKLLYSRAFRPPSLLERYQPTVPGTTILSEQMDTVEFQTEKRWTYRLTTSMNLYWFELNHLITSNVDSSIKEFATFTNNPKITGYGVETALQYRIQDTLKATLNYSYHEVSKTNNTGLLPEHMIKGLLNWNFAKDWSVSTQLDWVGERRRPANDIRPNLGNYVLVGLTLATQLAKPVEFKVRVNNLLGVNAREPSLNGTFLPGDIPIFDRSIVGQLIWSF